jgi:ribosomal protein S27AE
MATVLQRWRCGDCGAVYDVFVDDATGRAEQMKDELCPTCQHGGHLRIGFVDLRETALLDGEGGA